jgi:hypothetical protein
MFSWINKQGVQSDQGFIVQFTGRLTAEYREGPLTIVVDVEDGGGSGNPMIYYRADCFHRWTNSSIVLTETERARVVENFREAMKFQGLTAVEYSS